MINRAKFQITFYKVIMVGSRFGRCYHLDIQISFSLHQIKGILHLIKVLDILIAIKQLLISNAHRPQEWQPIVNTTMTKIQIFLQQKLTLHILQV
jgi:hypothetical protein